MSKYYWTFAAKTEILNFSPNSTQKYSLSFSSFSLLDLLEIQTEGGRGSSSFFFLSQKVWRLAWAAFARLLWLTYGLMTLRHRLVGKTTLEFPNEIVTVICFISALYCPISVWVEGCVWLPWKYFCFANYSFQRSCCLPGYVRTFICLLCCVGFLNFFVWLFWFCLFGFFCKQCLSDIWLLFYFFFFLLKNIIPDWKRFLQNLVLQEVIALLAMCLLVWESWFSFLLLYLPRNSMYVNVNGLSLK